MIHDGKWLMSSMMIPLPCDYYLFQQSLWLEGLIAFVENNNATKRSTRRAQTSLAEADYYPHIAQSMNKGMSI